MAVLLILAVSFQSSVVRGNQSPYIHIEVTDASTDSSNPIEGAIVLVWDLNTIEKPSPGRGIYFTDENGECNITGSYVIPGHVYKIYAYKADFLAEIVEYVPAVFEFTFLLYQSSYNVSLGLLPGALVVLEGNIYSVEASGLSTRLEVTIVDPQTGSSISLGETLARYDSISQWFMGSSPRYVAVPAKVPVKVEAETVFLSSRERPRRVTFLLEEAGGKPFSLTKGSKIVLDLSQYSLEDSLRVVQARSQDVTSLLNEAQNVGFMVFEERRSLVEAGSKINEGERNINSREYDNAWILLREAYVAMDLISARVSTMRLTSLTSSVYLPAVLSVFAVILAFFLFEENKKKMMSSAVVYSIFLVAFYLIYPGISLIINENARLFLLSAGISFAVTMVVVFGVPRVWRERQVEGEVSLRSAVSIIFSMGKRQIRRKKIRGSFTIFSMVLLILAFTSLTSFGAAYGLVLQRVNITPSFEGILVERLKNETSTFPIPLGFDEPSVLSNSLPVRYVAPRIVNQPVSGPLGTLVNPATGRSIPLYGVLGIDPANESLFTRIDGLVREGEYLDVKESDEILLSTKSREALGASLDETVDLYISGVSGLLGNFTIKGVFGDEDYTSLADIDGRAFGPLRFLSDGSLRPCNGTELILMNWRTLIAIQQKATAITGGEAPSFVTLSKIAFQPVEGSDLDSMVNTLVFVFDYDVFVSFDNEVTHYFIGSFIESKGAVELLVPLIMAGLNVGAVMLNAVYERRKEIAILSMVGLNPAHIAATFVAEAVIIGMVGGGLGYLFGLGFYRLIALIGQGFMVREKLEWWWSAIAFAIAMTASVLSAVRPATLAVSMYTPSRVRKIKIEEEEKETRKDELFKAFQARELSMPAKVTVNEMPFFVNYIIDRLRGLSTTMLERTEDIEEQPEVENVKGEIVKNIKFNYFLTVSGEKRGTKNELIGVKSPGEDSYRVRLKCAPFTEGTPVTMIDRTIDFVHDLVLEWLRNKKKTMGLD